jgi:signal transduction histidine kinase
VSEEFFHQTGNAVRERARAGKWIGLGASDSVHVEETLATARLVAALLFAVLTAPASHVPSTYGVLLAYAAYAAAVRLALREQGDMPRVAQHGLHALDLVIPIGLGVILPAQPLSGALYLVPLMGAAMRWGAGATLASLSVAMIVALHPGLEGPLFPHTPVEIVASLLIGGSLFALVGLLERHRRSHMTALAGLRERSRLAGGFRMALSEVLDGLVHTFRSSGARVTAHNARANRTFLWDFSPLSGTNDVLQCRELYGHPPHPSPGDAIAEDRLTVPFSAEEWSGWLELFEPAASHRSPGAVRFLEDTVRDLAVTLHDLYAMSNVRSRAVLQERARLARQLHDGTIQSLIAAEMQLDALCRRGDGPDRARSLEVELRKAQDILRQEILSLRDLMARMKPLEVTPAALPAHVSQIVDRFSRDSGIRAEFSGDGIAIGLAPQDCVELARVVQEALSNARKHSGATLVRVSLRSVAQSVSLIVEDNGRGFDFDGTVTVTDRTPAPQALRESVRVLGGRLVIDSKRGQGARLEVTIPAASAAAGVPAFQRVAS